jgi:large subunit ribosomal protein L6
MRQKIEEKMKVAEGVSCSIANGMLVCSKAGAELARNVRLPNIVVKIQGDEIIFSCEKGNKNDLKIIRAHMAHIRNMFHGLDKKYVYQLESCNVHFPVTLKVEKDRLVINNFLGEKVPRHATILPNVIVEIKGAKITITSHDKEAAGQTAANFEKATVVKNRDRRIFQDGIYITDKPGRME